MGDTETFVRLRPSLFGLAHRMLGSATEAEDVVHEADLRWSGPTGGDVESPAAYLRTIVTRLRIDVMRSARGGGRRTRARGYPTRRKPRAPIPLIMQSWPTRCRSPSRFSSKSSSLLNERPSSPPGASSREVTIDGQPGIVSGEEGRATIAIALDVLGDLVVGVRVVTNLDKLSALQPGHRPDLGSGRPS